MRNIVMKFYNDMSNPNKNSINQTLKIDTTVWDFPKALFIPIGIVYVIEAIENDEEPEQILYDLILNTYGIGVQEY